MPNFNVHEAKTQFSQLLDLALEGERIVITRNGKPIVELTPARDRSFPLGAGRDDPGIDAEALRRADWWRPMTDEEADAFLDGRD